MRRYCLLIALFVVSIAGFCQPPKPVTIRYYAPKAEKVSWYWYINNLELLSPLPPNTQIDWNIMRTNMVKNGDFFECTVSLPSNVVITHGFSLLEKTKLTKKPIGYIDLNNKYPSPNYLFATDTANIISIYPNKIQYATNTYISTGKFCKLLLGTSLIFFLLIYFFSPKKVSRLPHNSQHITRWLSAITTCMLLLLALRIYHNALTHFLLAAPTTIFLPALYSIKADTILVFITALVFFIIQKIFRIQHKWPFYAFVFCALLIWVCNFLNAKFYTLTSQNFNYPWLYYASFFGSKDSTLALAAHLNKYFFLELISFFITGILLYKAFKRTFVLHRGFLISCLLFITLIACLPKPTNTLAAPKNKNAIIHFIQSLFISYGPLTGSPKQANDFILHTQIPTRLQEDSFSSFKNVIVLVLESVPHKYLSVYNEAIATTPFLLSLKDKSWQFENIYAHVPATNKSMESLVCASFPLLSYKTLTYENPSFPIPGLPQVLKEKNYRTAFFTSGDTRYLNQEMFLRNHGFETVQDYRAINKQILSTPETEKEFLSGMPDSMLHQQITDWIDQKPKQPFFCMGWTFQTHYPYFSNGKKAFATNNIFKERYLNAISDADALIQQLYLSLQKRKLLDSTLIVILGDHGEAFGEHAQTTHAMNIYEENVHIPLLLIHPSIQLHRKINTPGAISDIAPTILHLMNTTTPNTWQGESLLNPNKRNEVYLFTPYGDVQFGIISNNKKLILNDTRNTLAWYNLAADSLETKNTIHTDSVPANKALLQLQRWIQYQFKTRNF